MEKINLRNTGWKPHKSDYRDLLFGDVLPTLELPRDNVTKKLPVDWQGSVPKCVMETYSYVARKQDYKETNIDFALSADAGYSWVKNYLDKDRNYGTSLLAGAKTMVRFGLPEESIYADDEANWNNLDAYFDIGRFTGAVNNNAKIHSKELFIRGTGFDWGNVYPEELKQMVFQREAAAIAMRGDSEFFKGGKYPLPPLSSSQKWYHAMAIDSWRYINNKLEFRFANTFEPDPNKRLIENGLAFGWLRWDLWQPHIWGNYTTVDKPNVYPQIDMLKMIRAIDDPKEKVYALISGHRKWLQDPEELKLWQDARLVGTKDDIENVSIIELRRYPVIKMTFCQFVTNYFDK